MYKLLAHAHTKMTTSQETGVGQLDWESFQRCPRVRVLRTDRDGSQEIVGNMPQRNFQWH